MKYHTDFDSLRRSPLKIRQQVRCTCFSVFGLPYRQVYRGAAARTSAYYNDIFEL